MGRPRLSGDLLPKLQFSTGDISKVPVEPSGAGDGPQPRCNQAGCPGDKGQDNSHPVLQQGNGLGGPDVHYPVCE